MSKYIKMCIYIELHDLLIDIMISIFYIHIFVLMFPIQKWRWNINKL